MKVEVFNLEGGSIALFDDIGEFEINQDKGLPLVYKIKEEPPVQPRNDLGEIRAALGLSDDTPEALVGVIWHLQQRVEGLEELLKEMPVDA